MRKLINQLGVVLIRDTKEISKVMDRIPNHIIINMSEMSQISTILGSRNTELSIFSIRIKHNEWESGKELSENDIEIVENELLKELGMRYIAYNWI